jgi:hypothetical protein
MTRQIIGTARCDRRQYYQRSTLGYVHGVHHTLPGAQSKHTASAGARLIDPPPNFSVMTNLGAGTHVWRANP